MSAMEYVQGTKLMWREFLIIGMNCTKNGTQCTQRLPLGLNRRKCIWIWHMRYTVDFQNDRYEIKPHEINFTRFSKVIDYTSSCLW